MCSLTWRNAAERRTWLATLVIVEDLDHSMREPHLIDTPNPAGAAPSRRSCRPRHGGSQDGPSPTSTRRIPNGAAGSLLQGSPLDLLNGSWRLWPIWRIGPVVQLLRAVRRSPHWAVIEKKDRFLSQRQNPAFDDQHAPSTLCLSAACGCSGPAGWWCRSARPWRQKVAFSDGSNHSTP